jgi:hypothetical protein
MRPFRDASIKQKLTRISMLTSASALLLAFVGFAINDVCSISRARVSELNSLAAGVVGHRQYLFDLWGDTVNTAARVESHGAEGCVNVSEAAWAMVREHCCGTSLGLIQVKGKGEMELFRVDGLRA